MEPFLSFCIPTYNGADLITEIVMGILQSELRDFQVVISDDASSDDTKERILNISDKRIKYICNDRNLGAKLNWMNALDNGDGEYLYLVMGRDRIHGESIEELIKKIRRLSEQDVICFKDRYDEEEKQYHRVEGIIRFLGYEHPTGIILHRDSYNAISDRKKIFSEKDSYPENTILFRLLQKGNGAIINSGAYRGETIAPLNLVRSSFEKEIDDIDKLFFSPNRRYVQFEEIAECVLDDNKIKRNEKVKIFLYKYNMMLGAVSLRWRRWNTNAILLAHYGRKYKDISRKEMWNNIIDASVKTRNYLKQKRFGDPFLCLMMFCLDFLRCFMVLILWRRDE